MAELSEESDSYKYFPIEGNDESMAIKWTPGHRFGSNYLCSGVYNRMKSEEHKTHIISDLIRPWKIRRSMKMKGDR